MKQWIILCFICLEFFTIHADYSDYSVRKLQKQHTDTNYRSVRNYNPYSSPSFAETESCKLNIECGNSKFKNLLHFSSAVL